ncbi:hypothetical protein KEM55_005647 [Ascosphaera atra]|nr:hypothetical protein KEM55_005647 [Ascosphaera atra]
MIDTLGINARSLASYLLYQEVEKDESNEEWLDTLRSERASDLLDGPLLLSDVDKLQEGIDALYEQLREGQKGELKGILADIQQLLGKDLVQLRGQCSNLRRVIDVHTDAVAIASAPLSPEQTTLQQDLRKSFTGLQSKIANLESDLFMLRAKIADSTPAGTSGSRGRRQMGRPSVSAVESTIATIQRMAKEKSASIDMLEAQFRKLGLDVGSRDREDTPAHEIPDKKEMEVFHTMPGMLSGTRRHLRAGWAGSASGVLAAIPDEELQRFKERAALRKKGMGFIRKAMDQREHNVREMNVP